MCVRYIGQSTRLEIGPSACTPGHVLDSCGLHMDLVFMVILTYISFLYERVVMSSYLHYEHDMKRPPCTFSPLTTKTVFERKETLESEREGDVDLNWLFFIALQCGPFYVPLR